MSEKDRRIASARNRFGAKDLDGHTMEELSDYLDSGRHPENPSIESSPGCLIALDALARLRALGPALIERDTADEPPVEESWVQRVITGIAFDARAGRRIPLESPEPDDLGMTEGAVRGLIRAAERAVPGIVIGRSRLDGDVTLPGAPVRVDIEVSVPYGPPIAQLTGRLRAEIAQRLHVHTLLNVIGIDITVHDLRDIPPSEEQR